MKKYLLPETGRFYKANLHCHSNWSDGNLSPEELKRIYKEQGYSVLSITDHESIFDHTHMNDEDFLLIPGYEKELNSVADDWEDVITTHLCIYPKKKGVFDNICFDPDFVHPKFRWMHTPELKARVTYVGEPYKSCYGVEHINHFFEEAQKRDYFITLNHPWWNQAPMEDFLQFKGMSAMEIFNFSSSRGGMDEYDERYYDFLLRKGNRIRCIAADDNHNSTLLNMDHPYFDSFGGYTMIKAEELTHEAIMDALVKGNTYASGGPEIKELYYEDGRVHIETSKAVTIVLSSGNRYTRCARKSPEEGVTSADFDVRPVKGYFRITVTDQFGRKAYTNAYFPDEYLK